MGKRRKHAVLVRQKYFVLHKSGNGNKQLLHIVRSQLRLMLKGLYPFWSGNALDSPLNELERDMDRRTDGRTDGRMEWLIRERLSWNKRRSVCRHIMETGFREVPRFSRLLRFCDLLLLAFQLV
ncbi:hypothetical protein ATANTOWER_024000 [Ataeniobius toweri]|uniref:Uncharacterized protein n=1 Tax=Ataeniobius toweri TaxID=208326 RepID=A0ABU7B8A7_9TELE|nr:hypothetical protein [Ataeniobius toweri]